ncbi:MAG TPA: hypothetical protein VEQ42_02520, partial [Pyrinomonadaceae bacterium]|nr:hypothetical protein [Pyrinomonadaceae bacterium]
RFDIRRDTRATRGSIFCLFVICYFVERECRKGDCGARVFMSNPARRVNVKGSGDKLLTVSRTKS